MNDQGRPPAVIANRRPVVENPMQVPVTQPVRRRAATIVLAVIGFVVLSAGVLVVAWYLLVVLGPGALLVAAVLATIPLLTVLAFIRWIDRWEPEPRGSLLFAFLWGAGVAVLVSLVFSGITQVFEARAGLRGTGVAAFFETVVQAPVVEESAKGFGILLLLWAMRRTFDGPVDGIVYGATIAIGFAFTENLQYFGLAINQDRGVGGVLVQTFVLRAILSPFAHVMFTAATGLVLGIAARRTGPFGAIGYYVLGLIPAIVLHSFWNSAGYWATDWFSYYVLVQLPLFIVGVAIVAALRRHEQRLTRERLAEYAAVGWFTPSEVNLLSTGEGRRQGMAWATRNRLGPQYRRFVRDATSLAFTRERLVNDRQGIGSNEDEGVLLSRLIDDRRALASLPPLPVGRFGF